MMCSAGIPQGVAFYGIKASDTVLFMDGCSAHHTDECEDAARQLGIRVERLPPNCTPVLQPCDQYVNALFKQYYQDEWFEWYKLRGSKQYTRAGRLRRATEAETNQWIANATARLIANESAIRASWRDTLLSSPHLMRLPDSAWARFGRYRGGSPYTFAALSRRRGDYDGSKYDFPVTKRRKRKAGAAAAASESQAREKRRPLNESTWSDLPGCESDMPPSALVIHQTKSVLRLLTLFQQSIYCVEGCWRWDGMGW